MKFIITADWHTRGERPRCRTDEDWLGAQRKDVAFCVDMAIAHNAILVIVGDLFHTPRTATEVVNMIIAELQRLPKDQLFILPGNHDLPYHAYHHLSQSSIGTLLQYFNELKSVPGKFPKCKGVDDTFFENWPETQAFGIWDAYPFGLDEPGKALLRFVHRLVFPDNDARPIEECGQTAEDMTKEYPDNKFIICGDYHHAFLKEFPETFQTVINPGCLNIQAADMIDYQPQIVLASLYESEKDISIEFIDVPQPKDAFTTDDYLVAEKERDERLDAFMETVESTGEVSLSFRESLEKRALKTSPEVQEIVTGILQEVSNESK